MKKPTLHSDTQISSYKTSPSAQPIYEDISKQIYPYNSKPSLQERQLLPFGPSQWAQVSLQS